MHSIRCVFARRLRLSVTAAVVAAACAVCVGGANAQVFEVGPNGVIQVSPKADPRPAPEASGVLVSGAAKTQLAAVQPLLNTAGAAVELSPRLVEAVAYVESRFRIDARSKAGAIGTMQLMPETASDLGVDPAKPEQNIHGGAKYLRQMLQMFGGNVELALAAYNAGPAAVRKYNGVPPYPETRAYVAAVLDYLANTSLEDEES